MTLAIFGGTFNPVHVGHLFLAEEVKTHSHYDRIIFVPAYIPVHKRVDFDVHPEHRLRMLEIATAPHPEFQVDDCELSRGGDSYTIDTVQEIISRYPTELKPGLIIGDDLAADFDTWKEASLLAGMTDLIIAHRISSDRIKINFPCTYIENSLLPVSSSEIRERLSAGKSIRYLVPDKVIQYIETNGLYL